MGFEALTGVVSFTPALGEAMCGRVAAGVSLRALCREPGMPCRRSLQSWARVYPEFGAALRAAQATARLAARMADRARREVVGIGRGRAVSTYSRELGAAICARIADGESLIGIARDAGMPRAALVYDWIKQHREFEEMYVLARQRQADSLFDEALEVTRGATPGTVWADRLRFDGIRWATARLAPKKYCEKVIVVEAMKAPAEADRLTVIVKRYCDVTPEEMARAEEGEP
ncbi:MAG: terminase small subunit protein [Phenylobacterium sp.]|nr:terminase small subunit protein [Phenylobacterium sp.]